MRSSLFSVFYWWVIAAAFIGPGTVTAAARALNGLLLPLTGVTLALVLHRPALRAAAYATGPLGSLALISSVCVTIALGITAILRLFEYGPPASFSGFSDFSRNSAEELTST